MKNCKGRTISSFDLANEMMADRRISLDGYTMQHFRPNEYRDAFRLTLNKPAHVINVIFEIG